MQQKPRKSKSRSFLIAICTFTLLLIIAYPLHLFPSLFYKPTSFTFNNSTYKFTSVATTLQQLEQGLMNTSVTNSTFELFVFPVKSVYPFWMKDTYYPLDIIWVNGSTVTYIVNAIPCSSYSPNQTACILYNNYSTGRYANYVIEAQAGFVNRTGMTVGSKVQIN